MNDVTPKSEAELRDLVTQAIALEYLKYQRPSSHESKPKWLQLFESAGFVAIVTVVLGGLVGSWVTSRFQEKSKDREQQVARRQLEHDRNLAAFNEHLDRERKIVDEMLAKVGALADTARGLSHLSRAEWSGKDKPATEQARLAQERHKIVERYNQATAAWDADRLRLGIMLELEHDNDPVLLDAWRNTGIKVEAYSVCCDRWRMKHDDLAAHEAEQGCAAVLDELETALKVFTDRIIALRNGRAAAGFGETPNN